jgi:hypothetical protein
MVQVEVGQTVMVNSGYGRKDVVRGTVVKVARVWIDVHREGQNWGWRFRKDDQTNGSDFGSVPHFYTLEQWAEHLREVSATDFLRAQGVSVEYSSPWHGRMIELATLLGWVAPEDALLS